MCDSDNEPGSHDPDVVASLKELATKGSGKHRIVCESDGVATEYWLEGGEVRSREVPSAGQAAPSMAAFEAAALSEFAALVPKLESELDGKEVADLDGIEIAIRDVTHSSGAAMYKSLLERVDAELPTPDCPECGKPMERHQKFGKSFASRLGPVEVERTYCRCRDCGSGLFPLDRALGLEGQTATPGAASIVADAVVSDSFEEASRKLRNLAGVKVPATTLRRWTRELGEEAQRFEREVVEEGTPGAERVYVEADGTGVPMRRSETEGAKGKQEDGSARTREAKVIVTFTAEGTHPKTGEADEGRGQRCRERPDRQRRRGRRRQPGIGVRRPARPAALPGRRLQGQGGGSHLRRRRLDHQRGRRASRRHEEDVHPGRVPRAGIRLCGPQGAGQVR